MIFLSIYRVQVSYFYSKTLDLYAGYSVLHTHTLVLTLFVMDNLMLHRKKIFCIIIPSALQDEGIYHMLRPNLKHLEGQKLFRAFEVDLAMTVRLSGTITLKGSNPTTSNLVCDNICSIPLQV